ncbi:hypothetical protein [Parendozoicomonas haliclonae]|uniref:Tetratricopeptide repeat protein n=1 Tax=Parendozoicomonas haliclonae TaxID=1960125 RepID=A0A1X7AKB6_9GAMM|nr:hypothetical protein [Parendozoicomonas haliclonae]SMA43503.1 hypothetical protein EHSB41UT_01608 [Parendozoicomonas haliclonae]
MYTSHYSPHSARRSDRREYRHSPEHERPERKTFHGYRVHPYHQPHNTPEGQKNNLGHRQESAYSQEQTQRIRALHERVSHLGKVESDGHDRHFQHFVQDYEKDFQRVYEDLLQERLPERRSLHTQLLFRYAALMVFGGDYRKALTWMKRLEPYEYLKNPRSYQEYQKLKAKALDRYAHDCFYNFGDIKGNKQPPESIQFLRDVVSDRDTFNLMEPEHQAEYLSCMFWYAIEFQELSFADHCLEWIEGGDMRDRYLQALESNPFGAFTFWTCYLGWLSVSQMQDTSSPRIIGQLLDQLCEDAVKVLAQARTHGDWLPIFLFYQARVICLPVWLLQESPDDEQKARSLLAELESDPVEELYVRGHNQGRYERLISRVLIHLGDVLLSWGRAEEIPELIEKMYSLRHYVSVETSSILRLKAEARLSEIKKNRGSDSLFAPITLGDNERLELSEYAENLTRLAPHNRSRCWVVAGLLYVAMGDREQAEHALKQYRGKATLGYRLRAQNLSSQGRLLEACEIYQQLTEADSTGIYAMLNEYALTMNSLMRDCEGTAVITLQKRIFEKIKAAVLSAPEGWRAGWNALGHHANDLAQQEQLFPFRQYVRELPDPVNRARHWGEAASIAFNIANSPDVQSTIDDYRILQAEDFCRYQPEVRRYNDGTGRVSGRASWRNH